MKSEKLSVYIMEHEILIKESFRKLGKIIKLKEDLLSLCTHIKLYFTSRFTTQATGKQIKEE